MSYWNVMTEFTSISRRALLNTALAGVTAMACGSVMGADIWLKDPITGCLVWGGKEQAKELLSWSGECKDGKALGLGASSL